jgi:hypothetical protein
MFLILPFIISILFLQQYFSFHVKSKNNFPSNISMSMSMSFWELQTICSILIFPSLVLDTFLLNTVCMYALLYKNVRHKFFLFHLRFPFLLGRGTSTNWPSSLLIPLTGEYANQSYSQTNHSAIQPTNKQASEPK